MSIGYTICFIKRGEELLMLNRNSPPVCGMWNGVGGKLEEEETPLSCVRREVKEETGLTIDEEKFHYKGTISWVVDGERRGGMHAFVVRMHDDYGYQTPIEIDEGILTWKDVSWVFSEDNHGVSPMIPYYLPSLLKEVQEIHHHFTVHNRIIIDYMKAEERIDVVVP